MKSDIILSGVGGQGILSIAATIGMAALSFCNPELDSGSLKCVKMLKRVQHESTKD